MLGSVPPKAPPGQPEGSRAALRSPSQAPGRSGWTLRALLQLREQTDGGSSWLTQSRMVPLEPRSMATSGGPQLSTGKLPSTCGRDLLCSCCPQPPTACWTRPRLTRLPLQTLDSLLPALKAPPLHQHQRHLEIQHGTHQWSTLDPLLRVWARGPAGP